MTTDPWKETGVEVLRADDFTGTRLNRSGTYIVCFAAAWCPATRRFMPTFLGERGRMGGTLAIADITDLDSPLWDRFRIRITPSILVFESGEVHGRLDGRRFFGISRSALRTLESVPHDLGRP